MSLVDRIGILGVILALIVPAISILWPDKKWIGWVFLVASIIFLIGWGWLEFGKELPHIRTEHPILTQILIFLVGGCIAIGLWRLLIPVTNKNRASQPTQTSSSVSGAAKLSGSIEDVKRHIPQLKEPTIHSQHSPDLSMPLVLKIHIYNNGLAKIINQGKVPIRDIAVRSSSHVIEQDYMQKKVITMKESSFSSGSLLIHKGVLVPSQNISADLTKFMPFGQWPPSNIQGPIDLMTKFYVWRFTFYDDRTGEIHACYRITSSMKENARNSVES